MAFYEKHVHPDERYPIIFHAASSGIFSGQSPVLFNAHWHEAIEILYFISGNGSVRINGESFNACAGDIIVINSNAIHAIYGNVSCAYHCLIISKEFCEQHSVHLPNDLFCPKIQDQALIELFNQILNENREKSAYYKEQIMALVSLLLVRLCRFHQTCEHALPTKKSDIVMQTLQYINENFSRALSIDELAQQLHLSKYYLCHVFKSVTGQSITEHLNAVRLNNARHLILSEGCTVNEAAQRTGFQNLSYFTRAYKNWFGHLPLADKKRASQKS